RWSVDSAGPIARASKATGAITMAPVLLIIPLRAEAVTCRSAPSLRRFDLSLDVLVHAGEGILDRHLAGHDLADAGHEHAIDRRRPLPGRQGVRRGQHLAGRLDEGVERGLHVGVVRLEVELARRD